MSTKIKYTDEPMGDVRILNDSLPSPDELAFKEKTIKITITLSKSSVDYFKKKAKSHNTQYQRMIRRLFDEYVSRHKAL